MTFSQTQIEVLQRDSGLRQRYNRGPFTSDEARGVLQHEIAVTNSLDDYPLLASYGAGPCVIMALYNPQTRVAALCHIDSFTDLRSLDTWIAQVKGDEDSSLEVHLAGGEKSSQRRVIELLDKIAGDQHLVIKSASLIGSGMMGKRLAIDSRTGEIFTDFEVTQIAFDEASRSKNRGALLPTQPTALRESVRPQKQAKGHWRLFDPTY